MSCAIAPNQQSRSIFVSIVKIISHVYTVFHSAFQSSLSRDLHSRTSVEQVATRREREKESIEKTHFIKLFTNKYVDKLMISDFVLKQTF